VPVQALVQLPQWSWSEATATQVEPHSMNPLAHWHWPETQLWPVEQLLSQLPQCWALLARSKQPALHSV
jgi:hypothetical protein